MAIRGSQKNYSFGSKNHWRRTIWNEVLRRTQGRERDGYVLYLAGANNLDHAVAIEKRVPEHNLVAIDIRQSNIKSA